METPVQYNTYKSRFITGCKKHSRTAAEVCLREASLWRFWVDAIRAIRGDSLSDTDGEIFTSDYLGVWLGPYDVEVKHRYRWCDRKGGDSYMGRWEDYAELVEGFEVVSARDEDNDENLPGLVAVMNEYYRKNELKLNNYY